MIVYKSDLNGISKDNLNGFFVGWRTPISPEKHIKILQNSYIFVLAIDDTTSQIIGFVNAISDKTHYAFIPMIEVLPKYQNMGIGSKLMKKILAKFEELKCIDLICDAELQPFYEKFNMNKSFGMIIRKHN